MWRSKKFIIVAALATVILAGSIGGIALANDDGDDNGSVTLFDRVTAILADEGVNITSDQLKDAFTQARSDMQTDALKDRLDSMVEEGKITQSEADEYLEWWGAKPDISVGFGIGGRGGFHGMQGMHGMRGFGDFDAPGE